MLQPATFEVEQAFWPCMLALAVAIPESAPLLVPTEIGAYHDEETMPRFLQAGLAGHAIAPARAPRASGGRGPCVPAPGAL